MYMSRVMRDIKQELGPLLKELRLRHKLTQIEPEFYHQVIFETMGNVPWRSPVELKFPIAAISGKDKADWADVVLWHRTRKCMPVGGNGWVMYEDIGSGPNVAGTRIGSKDVALGIVANSLESLELFPNGPPFPEGRGLPNVVHNTDLQYDLEHVLPPYFEEYGIKDFHLHRNAEGEESFSFERGGQVVEFRYAEDDNDIVLSFDGKEIVRGRAVTNMLFDFMSPWRSFNRP